MWENIIMIAILAAILGFAIAYIVKAKKNGKQCVGCPYAGECGKKSCECKATMQKEE